MNLRQTALLAAITLSGCAAIAPQQASEPQTHIDSPVFQAGSTGSWSGYTIDFSTGDVTGSGAPAVTAAAPGSRTGRN